MSAKLTLQTPIDDLYMVGEKYADYLKRYLNISTVEDLVYYFPFRYEDLSQTTTLDQAQEGQTVTLQGQIVEIKNVYTRYGKQIQKAKFSDGTAMIDVTWFNQPYLVKNFNQNPFISIAGKINRFGGKLALSSPQFEMIKNQQLTTTHTGRLVPIYPETALVSSKWLRSRIKPLVKELNYLINDWLPVEISDNENFISLTTALQQIHFPQNENEINQAKSRLAFDELFLLQLQMLKRKKDWQAKELRHHLNVDTNKLIPFIKNLPFNLTTDQQKSLEDILADLQKDVPMNRLLEGDVGSGKTVIAAAAIYLLYQNGLKSVLMAPTEVLANQHLNTLEKLLKPMGIKIGFFTGSNKSKEALSQFDVYLGTHALLYQKLDTPKIGLVIIDEQHRFGVSQRAEIIGEKQIPHVLTMTATPIPRTVALTIYGDLTLSLIKEMPIGRKQIKTWVVSENKREDSYLWIKNQIKQNHTQAYFIYPLIDPSDKGTMKEVKAATVEYENLSNKLPDLKIGLLHGRMKSKEKATVMEKFAKGELDILVSTTVIEVGVDVANASIMVINDAQRFGLSQLHQLRGRVGRGNKQSYCLLFADNTDLKRLKAMESCHSGIELAELDLKLRGPGQIYGIQQSGFLDLKIASFNDPILLTKTKNWAELILPKIENYPLLKVKLDNCIISSVQPN